MFPEYPAAMRSDPANACGDRGQRPFRRRDSVVAVPTTRTRAVAAITAAVALHLSGAVMACQCAELALAGRIAAADVVVVATVLSVVPLDHVTMTPTAVFKGAAPQALTIHTGRSDCDYFLPPVSAKAGEEYLLYLSHRGGLLTANRCLGSSLVQDKATELRQLRSQLMPGVQPEGKSAAPAAAR